MNSLIEIKAKKNSENRKNNKKIYMLSLCIMLVLSFAVVALAKFYKEEELTTVFSGDKIATYYIELTGADADTTLTQELQITNLNPGEDKLVEFYVSNGNVEKNRYSEVSMDYTIQIVHTDNIPLVYELYDSEGNKINVTNVTEHDDKYNNTGTSINYEKNNAGELFTLEIDNTSLNEVVSHKYTLKILWPEDDESANFKYVKEIDFLYININGYEHNPLKDN